jgi:5,10-methylenetetrahydromethanopterin reductase
MVTASAVATLERLAPGRVALAVGTGFTARYVMGRGPLTWATTERLIAQIVGLLGGETVEVDGVATRMVHPPGHSPDRPIHVPLIVGANGPKGLEVARRQGADGVVSIFGAQPGWEWSALFAYGTVLDDGEGADSERVLDAAGPGAAVVYHGMYEADPALLDGFDGGPAWRSAIEQFPDEERHLHTHELHFVGMTDRDRSSVTADLITSTTWTGPADQLRARISEAEASGVTEFWYAPMGSDVPRELRAFRSLLD